MEEFKERQRAIWSAGNYPEISDLISELGAVVVERAGVEPGMRILDVACGTGNAARPAARAGAKVTGLDLTPELLETGREKAAAEGLEIEWVQGDAEELPFEDDSFDRVLSTAGHMFAPRHRRTADEMARVCRGGGMIVTATWTPEGNVGEVFGASAEYMPPPPEFASLPILWGSEDYVRDMFPSAENFTFERRAVVVEWESADGWTDYFADRFGPIVVARQMLGERFTEFRNDLVAVYERWNQSSNGGFTFPMEYLISVVSF